MKFQNDIIVFHQVRPISFSPTNVSYPIPHKRIDQSLCSSTTTFFLCPSSRSDDAQRNNASSPLAVPL
jgi:hypothetical protein